MLLTKNKISAYCFIKIAKVYPNLGYFCRKSIEYTVFVSHYPYEILFVAPTTAATTGGRNFFLLAVTATTAAATAAALAA